MTLTLPASAPAKSVPANEQPASRPGPVACGRLGTGAADRLVVVNANIVMSDHSHIDRVHRLLDEYSPQLTVRLLNSVHQVLLGSLLWVARGKSVTPP